MFKKLDEVESRYNELASLLADPNVTSNPKTYTSYMKEYSSLQQLVTCLQSYKKTKAEFETTKKLLDQESDPDLLEMAREELPTLEKELQKLEEEMKLHLLPKDPNDEKNIFVEIRGGAGGDE